MAVKVEKQAVVEVKEYYRAEYSSPRENKYLDYLLKDVSNAVKLSNGAIYKFDKPSIKTTFCFGYGQNGISTEEESNNAFSMVKYANSNAKYFIEENMEEYNNLEKQLSDILEDTTGCKKAHAFKNRVNCPICYIRICDHPYYAEQEINRNKEGYLGVLSNEDVQSLLDTLQEEKVKFTKRLNTYLKRYGLSKLRTWTYLVD